MEARVLTPSTRSPSIVIWPVSGASTPQRIFSSVDLPHPMKPTTDTNSPRSTDSEMCSSTWRTRDVDSKDFERLDASMYDICCNVRLQADRRRPAKAGHYVLCDRLLARAQPCFGHPHHPIEQESDDADRQNRQENVRV